MINLSFINKALSDKDVSDSEFRLLYLIANNISFSGGEEMVFYNSFLSENLHKSERQIRNLTSSLCKKGYLIKRFSNEAGKEKNYYSLNEKLIGEKNFMEEKNFLPTEEKKFPHTEEKNFLLYNNTEEIINNNTCTSSNTREEQPTEKEIEKLMGELEGGCEETGRSSIMSEVNRKFTEDVNKIKTLTGRIKFLTTYEELERSCSSAEKYFESLSSSGKYHSEKQKRLARQLSDKYNEAFNRKAESLQRSTLVHISNKPQCEHFTLEDYSKLPELNL